MHLPWPVAGGLDPHKLDDFLAALLGDSLFDTLYAFDESGALVPSLAEGEPEPMGGALRVKLRPGLRFASGRALDARAAAFAIARARAGGGAAWLAEVPGAKVDAGALLFATRDAGALAHGLASPLAAIVPPGFAPERPDGTGPFWARVSADGLVLVRNPLSARAPAFLDEVTLRFAPDLSTSLRAFESGADDVGWLGSFLHEPRPGARPYDAGAIGWAILRTGREAGALDVPGTAQAIADGVPHAVLASLVVGPPWSTPTPFTWTGAPCDLLVRDDSPWMVELAKTFAAALSAPSHEVTVRPTGALDLAQRRAARSFALMLDIARPVGPGALGGLLGLTSADDLRAASTLARRPPRGGELSPRTITRTLRLGVVGELRVQGGRAGDLALPTLTAMPALDFGAAHHMRR
jgi:peptide/nickel transport system substrate-binding protein